MQIPRESQVSPALLKGIDLVFHGIYQTVQSLAKLALVNVCYEL